MTSTLTSKALITLLLLLIVSSAAAQGDFYYGDSGSISDPEFSIPQYDSQEEILTELAAPFLLIAFLLRFALRNALHFTLADRDANQIPSVYLHNNEPDVGREATIISLAITAMMIPTPMWDYARLMGQTIGLIPVAVVLILMLYTGYRAFSNW